MLERFTGRARAVVVFAQEVARISSTIASGPSTSSWACCAKPKVLAARVPEGLEITVEEARAQVIRIVGSGDDDAGEPAAFKQLARERVLEDRYPRSPWRAQRSSGGAVIAAAG